MRGGEVSIGVSEGLFKQSLSTRQSQFERWSVMELKGKKVIIIGERDGIQGPAIEACVRSAGAEPVLVQTQCFV